MTTALIAAQATASAEPSIGQALYVCSRIRGRIDVLEATIAMQDHRLMIATRLQLGELFDELTRLTTPRQV